MTDRLVSIKKVVDEKVKDALASYRNAEKHGLHSQAKRKLEELREKYQKVFENVKKEKDAMTQINHESLYEFRNMNSARMDPSAIDEKSYNEINFLTEEGSKVKGTNGVKTIPEMAERMKKIREMVFQPKKFDGSERNKYHCEYDLNQTSFFWQKIDFRELFIGSPMAQLEFLFYMMMCYDSRETHPLYDPESAKMFGLSTEDNVDQPNSRVHNGDDEGRFAGPTLRLPDEYRALAKCMMKSSDERKYLVRYGIPFGERNDADNIESKYNEADNKYGVRWTDATGNKIYPDIQFDVGSVGREALAGGVALNNNISGGQIAGIIQSYNLDGDGTDGLNQPGHAGDSYKVLAGHHNQNHDSYYGRRIKYTGGPANNNDNITLSMRGLNRRGFDLCTTTGNDIAAASGGDKNYESPFLPSLTDVNDAEKYKQHIHVVTNTRGFNVLNVGNRGPMAGVSGNFNDGLQLTGINSIQNRYILSDNDVAANHFRYVDSFGSGHTGMAYKAVKKGAIFGSYFGEPCLEDNQLQMTVGGHMINSTNNNPVNAGVIDDATAAGAAANFNIPQIFLRRFNTANARPAGAGGRDPDQRRRGNRNSNAGYVFPENTINIDGDNTEKFGTSNSEAIGSWGDPSRGLAANKGFIGNERGIATTTYTTSRLSLLYDIVYSNPFGATNPVGDQSRGYVDMMHHKRRGKNTLKEGQAPGHICTPRDFYVKCVLGRYVMFWNQNGTPANDCWDQEYFPAPGCVKQIFANANTGGEYVNGVSNSDNNGAVATILDRALPKVVHYAGRKVPRVTQSYNFTGNDGLRGEGQDAYCDYDGSENRGVRDAKAAYRAAYNDGGGGIAGNHSATPPQFPNAGGAGGVNVNDRTIVLTNGRVEKQQGTLKVKHAQKTVLTNFFCGNFSAAYQGTNAWDSIYQVTGNNGLAQFDGGYKTNKYLETDNAANYLQITGDAIMGKVTLQPTVNTAGGAAGFDARATTQSAFVYNKMVGATGGATVDEQYYPVSGVAPFNNFAINTQAAINDAQDSDNTGGVMKFTAAGLPNNITASAPAAGITDQYSGHLKTQGYCRYNLPGAQLSNSTTGAMFNAYRGLFSPTNIPTNVEIYAFCYNFARMIFNNLDEKKYPILSKTADAIPMWTNRMATKMAASICKIRELLFTDDLRDTEVIKKYIPNAARYAGNIQDNNKLGLTSVNDGLPGGGWADLLLDGGNPKFNGIISNPNLRQAIINIINKMIISRGDGFVGSGTLPRNIKGDDKLLMKRAVRFNSEGMMRHENKGINIQRNYNHGTRERDHNVTVLKRNNGVLVRPNKEYLPADCGRCDRLAIIDMGELYKCNLFVDESYGKLYLFDYIQQRFAENKGYINKPDLAPWITQQDDYKNLNIAKYGGLYKAPALGGIVQQDAPGGIRSSVWTVNKITRHFADLVEFWDQMTHRVEHSIGQQILKLDQRKLAEYQNNLIQIRQVIKGFIDSLAIGDKERIEQDKQLIEMTFTQHLDNVREKQKMIDNFETKLRGLKGKVHEIRLKATKIGSGTFLHSNTVKNELRGVADEAKNIKTKIEELRFEKRMASELVYEYFKIIDKELGSAEDRGTTGQYSKEIRDEILFIKKRLENMAITSLGASWKEGLEKGFSVLDQLASKPEMAKRLADLKRYSDILKKDFNGGLWIPVAYKKLLGKKIALLNLLTGAVIPDWNDLSKRTEFKGTIVVTSSDLKAEWYYMLPPDGDFPPKKKGMSVVDEEIMKVYRLRLFTGYLGMQSAAMRLEASALQSQASTGVNRAIWWATNGVKCGKGSVGQCPTKDDCASRADDPASPCGRVTTMAGAVTVIRRTVLADERFERSQLVSRLTTMAGGRKKAMKNIRTLNDKILDDLMKQFDL